MNQLNKIEGVEGWDRYEKLNPNWKIHDRYANESLLVAKIKNYKLNADGVFTINGK